MPPLRRSSPKTTHFIGLAFGKGEACSRFA